MGPDVDDILTAGGFGGYPPRVDVLVETRTDPTTQIAAVREALGGSESGEPYVAQVSPLRSVLREALAPRRFQALLAGVAAGTTLMIAVLGLFGVVSYSGTRRTRETGLREALGAPEATIVRGVVAEGVQLAFSAWRWACSARPL